MSRVKVTINWDMCQKCIFLVLINGSVYATAASLHKEYGSHRHLALRSATNTSEAPRAPPPPSSLFSPTTLPSGLGLPANPEAHPSGAAPLPASPEAHSGGSHSPNPLTKAALPAGAQPLSTASRVGMLAAVLSFSALVLLLCVLNVCAASPDCCPFEPGAIVDSDYSSESLAYARWVDAPRTCVQRCARTLTRLFFPLRAHAFYLPSRTDLEGDDHDRTNPWPSRIRALLFLSGSRDFPALRSCPAAASSLHIISSNSSSLSGGSRGVSGSASSPDTRTRRRRHRRHHRHHQPKHQSEDERHTTSPDLDLLRTHTQLGSFGLPKSLFANSTEISDKQLLKRLQRLERRLSRSERRALRREAREKRLSDSMLSYNRPSTKDRERQSRRRDKKRKKRERKHRKRDKRQKEKRRHGEKSCSSPMGSPEATTSTGERGTPLLEVLAPAKDVSSSSSSETVAHSSTLIF